MKTLQEWFTGEITKDMYDYQMLQYLGESTLHLHNKFMKGILFTCYSGEAALMSSLESAEADSKANDQGVSDEAQTYVAPPEPEASEWLTKVLIKHVDKHEDPGPPDLKVSSYLSAITSCSIL